MVFGRGALVEFAGVDAEGGARLAAGRTVHRRLQEAGRGVADAVGVGVDAGKGRRREGAEEHVVVCSENRGLARHVDAEFVGELQELKGAEVVRAEDGDGEGEAFEPGGEDGRVARGDGTFVEDDGSVRRFFLRVDGALLSRLAEAREKAVPPHVRVASAGEAAEGEGRVALAEEVVGRDATDAGAVRLDADEFALGEVPEDVDDGYGEVLEEAQRAAVGDARDDAVVAVQGAGGGEVVGTEQPEQPVATLLSVGGDAPNEAASVFARVLDDEGDGLHGHG